MCTTWMPAGLAVYKPASGKLITTLPVPAGHWNSPIAVDGHVIEPTGGANAHATSGELGDLLEG